MYTLSYYMLPYIFLTYKKGEYRFSWDDSHIRAMERYLPMPYNCAQCYLPQANVAHLNLSQAD